MPTPIARTAGALSLVGVLALLGSQRAAHAQATEGSLAGRVSDAGSGVPVSNARVVLIAGRDPETAEALSTRELTEVRGALLTETDEGGRYRFENVRPGAYVLRVERIGYRGATVAVQLRASERSSFSVAMQVQPILLDPVTVEAGLPAAAPRDLLELPPTGRITMERFRQEATLASDARYVSSHELVESATMAEPDLFRAMHRFAGVASRDDWTAELWTRGASWGETRVYLDGIPLFNPLHGFGVFSGFSHQGMGTALFQPGARTPRRTESAAAVLELDSRSGVQASSLEGGAELALSSAHVWARSPLQQGRGGWSMTGRRSYVDVLANRLAAEDGGFPFVFSDAQGRLDLELPVGQLEITALNELDEIVGELPDVLHRTGAEWGNLTAQSTLHLRPWGRVGSVTLGGTRYRATVDTIPGGADSLFAAPSEDPARHAVDYWTARAELRDPEQGWRGGVDVVRQRVAYRGPRPLPYRDRDPRLQNPPLDDDDALVHVGTFGEWRVRPAERLDIDVGLRASFGSEVQGSRWGMQPSVLARFRFTDATSATAGAGRYLQATQSPAPVGPRLASVLETGRYWTLSGAEEPWLDTRLYSVGAEHWLGTGALVSATLYRRSSTGNVLPDPREGFILERSPWVLGEVEAWGLDATVRRVAGVVTGSLAYSYADADAIATGVRFASPTDRTHTFDATGRVRLGSSRALQLAYTHSTGFPYVRTLSECLDAGCQDSGLRLSDPYLQRGPAYSSLDLVFASDHGIGSWTLGWFVQVRNVLGRDNAVTYEATREYCSVGRTIGGPCLDDTQPLLVDEFILGMPRAPLIGLRLTF